MTWAALAFVFYVLFYFPVGLAAILFAFEFIKISRMLFLTDLSSDHHFIFPSSGSTKSEHCIAFLHYFEDFVVYIELSLLVGSLVTRTV
jgi:hypothetical protein